MAHLECWQKLSPLDPAAAAEQAVFDSNTQGENAQGTFTAPTRNKLRDATYADGCCELSR